MRAVAVVEPGRVEIVELGKPEAGPYQALVRTEAACLCNATDGKLVAGHFPGVDKYPLVLGHEAAGIVEAVGSKVRNFNAGQRAIGGLVFEFADPAYASGWGGFCDYTLVNDHDAMVADGVADAEHGWFECYEIQRPVTGRCAAGGRGAPVHLARSVWRLWRFPSEGRRRHPGVRRGTGRAELRQIRGACSGWAGSASWILSTSKRAKALAMGADAAFSPSSPETGRA